MKNKVIVIEGNIGAGKSTLAAALARKLGGICQLEPAEGRNPYLSLYYKDPARYAFAMQIYLLSQRYRAHLAAQALALGPEGKVVISDRSYWGDLCFAAIQRDQGFLSAADFRTYTALHKDMQAQLLYPSAVIHLTTKPLDCFARIKRRMEKTEGRQCEVGIKMDYLRALDTQINGMVEGFSHVCPVISLDPINRQNDQEKTIEELVLECSLALHGLEADPDAPEFLYKTWQGVGGFAE